MSSNPATDAEIYLKSMVSGMFKRILDKDTNFDVSESKPRGFRVMGKAECSDDERIITLEVRIKKP